MRVLALDYGSARCGCAVSDPTGVLATPLAPVLAPATRRGLGRLRALVTELSVERVVVGLPLSLSGADSAQTSETRAFADRLARALSVPVLGSLSALMAMVCSSVWQSQGSPFALQNPWPNCVILQAVQLR